MKEYINGDNGKVSIDENVVAQVAGLTALDCFGIVGMGIVSVKDGIVKQLRRDNVSKGVNVKFDEKGDIIIEFHIVVAYGVSIKAVTDNLMQSVKYKVEDFTSLKVRQINVFVEDVKVMDQIAECELDHEYIIQIVYQFGGYRDVSNTIDALALKKAFIAGANNLDKNKEYINELITEFDNFINMYIDNKTLVIVYNKSELRNMFFDNDFDSELIVRYLK